jgi:hypothetical protein
MAAVALVSKVATIFARYQKKREKKKRNEKEGGTLCNNGRGPSFVSLFFFLQHFVQLSNSKDLAMFGFNSQRNCTWKTNTKASKSPSELL